MAVTANLPIICRILWMRESVLTRVYDLKTFSHLSQDFMGSSQKVHKSWYTVITSLYLVFCY